jgi:hypothetical protein
MPPVIAEDREEEELGPKALFFEIPLLRRDSIEKEVARLTKMAVRLGLPPPGFFVDASAADWRTLGRTLVRKDEDGAIETNLPTQRVEVAPAWLIVPPAGWEPAAEWKVAAVLLKTDTDELEVFGRGQSRANIERWSHLSLNCEHCRRNVGNRIRTLLLSNKKDGREMQVGVECAQGYVGEQYAKFVGEHQFYDAVTDFINASLESGAVGAGCALITYPAEEVVAHAVAAIRTHGWMPSRDEEGRPNVGSTADRVEEGMHYIVTCPSQVTYKVEETDRQEARQIVDWLAKMSEEDAAKGGSYLMALAAAFTKEWISEKRVRFVASAPRAFLRQRQQRQFEEKKSLSQHQGCVGQKIEFVAKLERCHSFDTQWGTTCIFSFRDTAGNAFVWKTSSMPITDADVGSTFTLRGAVKAHGDFRGEKQTELTRVKVQPLVQAVESSVDMSAAVAHGGRAK